MSLATLFDRTVTLELTSDSGDETARGNEVRSTSTIEDVPAYRSQLSADEDTADRDQQARTFVYFLPVAANGAALNLEGNAGRGRVLDGDDALDIVGEPLLASKRGRPHHYEVRAYLREG